MLNHRDTVPTPILIARGTVYEPHENRKKTNVPHFGHCCSDTSTTPYNAKIKNASTIWGLRQENKNLHPIHPH